MTISGGRCNWSSDRPCTRPPDDGFYPWWCRDHGNTYRADMRRSRLLLRTMVAEAEEFVDELLDEENSIPCHFCKGIGYWYSGPDEITTCEACKGKKRLRKKR